MDLTIVIPTVTGRTVSLDRTIDAYRDTVPHGTHYEVVTLRDRPSCGLAWQQGAERSRGDIIHITADDLVPHAGWYEAAVACLEDGAFPSPVLELPGGGYDGEILPDGAPARMTPCYFGPRELWPGCPDIHYWSDFWVSDALLAAGHEIRWCHGFRFTHHRVQDGPRRRMEARFMADGAVYRNRFGRQEVAA